MVCMKIHMSTNRVISNLTCMNQQQVMAIWKWSSGELCGPGAPCLAMRCQYYQQSAVNPKLEQIALVFLYSLV